MAGFLKRLKFWGADAVIENSKRAVSQDYAHYKSQTPERDRHFWLASAFMNRPGNEAEKNAGAAGTFAKTALFSVLNEEDAVSALTYFIISQEMPLAVLKIGKQWEVLMRPANDLIAQGKFLRKWEEANPWTAVNISGVRESVRAIQNKDKTAFAPLQRRE